MDYILTKIAAAAENPVTLAECKADSRIEVTAEDDLVEAYIDAATEMCSEIVGKKLVNETWKVSMPSFYGSCIELPFSNVSEITEIQYFDTDDVSQTLSVSDFYLYGYESTTVMQAKDGVSLPGLKNRRDALSVTLVTGYGDDAAAVPSVIKKAIRLIVAHWYQNREGTSGSALNEIPFGAESLLSLHRVGWVG